MCWITGDHTIHPLIEGLLPTTGIEPALFRNSASKVARLEVHATLRDYYMPCSYSLSHNLTIGWVTALHVRGSQFINHSSIKLGSKLKYLHGVRERLHLGMNGLILHMVRFHYMKFLISFEFYRFITQLSITTLP